MRDPDGLYAALNVSPTAGRGEIRLAYTLIKQAHSEGRKVHNIAAIQQAYETLNDPAARAEYDGGGARKRAGRPTRLHSAPLLAVLGAALLVALAIAFGPALKGRFVSFDAGEELYWAKTDKPLGQVVAYETDHAFPDGATLAAYNIRLISGETRWFPAGDLQRSCRRR